MSGMWAEARKHEKKIRGIVIDMRKRAERRRAHYDAIKARSSTVASIWLEKSTRKAKNLN